MKKKLYIACCFCALFWLTNCKVPYNPPATMAVTNYLVVEGLINITDSTYITLSRTVGVSSSVNMKPELKAIISIESSTGNTYALTELGNGSYAAAPLNLIAKNQYRLRIKTSNGEQYLSDFTNAMISPPIDSLNWKATTDLKIYVSTHDVNNATHYYRWDFNEAWEFHPEYNSQLVSDGLKISIRTPAQQVWDCFTGDKSSTISLGTSAALQQDVINQALINTIAASAEKISVKYTIGVTQYPLTKDAYDYWTLLKKNTEQLGSIFDSQPSSSIGNIHCINNPSEPVIGYISAGTISTGRIFITKQQLPNWTTTPFISLLQCDVDSLNCCPPPGAGSPYMPPTTDEFVNFKSPKYTGPLQTPIDSIYHGTTSKPVAVGVHAAPAICVDCTLRGSRNPPVYWK